MYIGTRIWTDALRHLPQGVFFLKGESVITRISFTASIRLTKGGALHARNDISRKTSGRDPRAVQPGSDAAGDPRRLSLRLAHTDPGRMCRRADACAGRRARRGGLPRRARRDALSLPRTRRVSAERRDRLSKKHRRARFSSAARAAGDDVSKSSSAHCRSVLAPQPHFVAARTLVFFKRRHTGRLRRAEKRRLSLCKSGLHSPCLCAFVRIGAARRGQHAQHRCARRADAALS